MNLEISGLREIVDELCTTTCLEREQLRQLLLMESPEALEYLYASARRVREQWYGKKVYVRGLIAEMTAIIVEFAEAIAEWNGIV